MTTPQSPTPADLSPIEDRAVGILALAFRLQIDTRYEPDHAVRDLAVAILDLAGDDIAACVCGSIATEKCCGRQYCAGCWLDHDEVHY